MIVKAVAGMEMGVTSTLFIFSFVERVEGLFKTGKNCDFFFKLGRAVFRIEALMHNALDNMIVITSKK